MYDEKRKHYYALSSVERETLLKIIQTLIQQKLAFIRKRRRISATQLADFFGKKSVNWVRTRETGKCILSLKDFIEVCFFYEIQFSDFFKTIETEIYSELEAMNKYSTKIWNERSEKIQRIGLL